MNRQLVIFDCDGTLVDSQHLIVAAMNQAFQSVRLPQPPREAILGIVGLSLPEAIWRLTAGGEEETVLMVRDAYRDAFGSLRKDPAHNEPMYDGARDAVLELAGRDDLVLGIATGKSRQGVDKLLERIGLKQCFETIKTADGFPSKPHPDMIHSALQETGASRSHAIMIGDTSFDMEMARNAGVVGLGVSWGYHPVNMLHESGAHGIATDYTHLLELIGEVQMKALAAE